MSGERDVSDSEVWPDDARLRLPQKVATDSAPEWIEENLAPVVYHLIGETARSDREHGLGVWKEATEDPYFYVTDTAVGGEDYVHTHDPPGHAGYQFFIHTHPLPGSATLSPTDWQSVVVDLLQYPPAVREYWAEVDTARAFCVLTQRPGDVGQNRVAMKVVYTGPAADDLTIEESKEVSQEMFDFMGDTPDLHLQQEIEMNFPEYLRTAMITFPLPLPADHLRYKTARPEGVGEREFDRAMADGDLYGVLRGGEMG
jgi:hypothetical protein